MDTMSAFDFLHSLFMLKSLLGAEFGNSGKSDRPTLSMQEYVLMKKASEAKKWKCRPDCYSRISCHQQSSNFSDAFLFRKAWPYQSGSRSAEQEKPDFVPDFNRAYRIKGKKCRSRSAHCRDHLLYGRAGCVAIYGNN